MMLKHVECAVFKNFKRGIFFSSWFPFFLSVIAILLVTFFSKLNLNIGVGLGRGFATFYRQKDQKCIKIDQALLCNPEFEQVSSRKKVKVLLLIMKMKN